MEFTKLAVEELKTLEEQAKPQKMGVSAVAAPTTFTHTHLHLASAILIISKRGG